MKHILLLEDDAALGRGICLALNSGAVNVTLCNTLAQGREALARTGFDLLVLDVNLPDGNGLDFLRKVRLDCAAPIILLTANDLETDIVTGLESGADDYITKPFSLAVLRARVNAQLRRSVPLPAAAMELEGFRFDFEQMEFRREGREVTLSRTEQKLLRVLVENRGQVLSRETLLERVWGTEFVDENALSVAVKRLRGKLEADPSRPRFIKTVYGIGYTWAVKR